MQDQVTAEMATELMKVMGIFGPSNGSRSKTHSRQRRQRIRLNYLCVMAITLYLSFIFLALYLVALAVHRWYFCVIDDGWRMKAGTAPGWSPG